MTECLTDNEEDYEIDSGLSQVYKNIHKTIVTDVIMDHYWFKEVFRVKKWTEIKPPASDAKLKYEILFKGIYSSIRREIILKYQKKFGDEFPSILLKAKSGDDPSFFRLVSFDRSWLFVDWVSKKITLAQLNDDKDFLNGLSLSLKYKVKSRNQNKSKVERDFYLFLRRFAWQRFLCLESDLNDLLDCIYEIVFSAIVEKNTFNLSEDQAQILCTIDILNDKKYFKKYMKRLFLI